MEPSSDPFDAIPPEILAEMWKAEQDEKLRRQLDNDPGTVSNDDSIRRSIRRARLAVFDLAVCNQFDLFSTLTFSPDEVDRDSYNDTYNALRIWLSNRVQRKGLRYVAVPEYHKDGHAIHFHMLSNSGAVDLIDSGHYAHREKVYNIPSWQKGFSTAQFIKGENAIDFTSKYVSKYMTKSKGNKVGGRFYLSGGDLVRPTYVYAESIDELVDPETVPKYEREISKEWGSFKEKSYI